jgi:multiple sugar transport system substrate-binding protein
MKRQMQELTKRGMLGLLMLGLTMLAAAGVTSPAVANPITLEVWMHDHPPRLPLDKKIVQEFEKANPDIKVNLTIFPYSTFDQRLQVAFAGGQGPAVFNNVSLNLGQYMASHILAPVDLDAIGVSSNDALRVKYGVGIDGATIDGKVYGLPTEVSDYLCAANNKLWKAAGLDPATDAPKTWEDMVTVAEKLTQRDKSGVPVVRGFDFNWTDPVFMWLTFNAMVEQAGGTMVDEATHKVDFDSKEVKKTMQYWSDWVNVHKLGGMQYTGSRDAFLGGQLAIECTVGPWFHSQFDNAGLSYSFFRIPRWKDAVNDRGFNAYSYYMMVNANADDATKAAAWKFANFYASHSVDLFTVAGLFTTTPEVGALKGVTEDPVMQMWLGELKKATYSPRIRGLNEVGDALARARDRIIVSGEDMDKVLTDLNTEARDILARQ